MLQPLNPNMYISLELFSTLFPQIKFLRSYNHMQQSEHAITRKASRLVKGAPDTPATVPIHILSDCNLSPFGSKNPKHRRYGLRCLTC
jgi:hypothetical protein